MKLLLTTKDGLEIWFEKSQPLETVAEVFDEKIHNIAELEEYVESGKYVWFDARVIAKKNGILLAEKFLGCCLYTSVEAFLETTEGYITGMKEAVIVDARETIKGLCNRTKT